MGHDRRLGQIPRKFGLQEIGVLDGPAVRSFRTIVEMALKAQHVDCVAFLVFDNETASARVRAKSGQIRSSAIPQQLVQHDSIASEVRTKGRTLSFDDLSKDRPGSQERLACNTRSLISSPVHGPAGEIVGVLTAMSESPVTWCWEQIEKQEDLAHLVSESILLRASMETLRLIASERQPIF